MVKKFLRELRDVWIRQHVSWRTVVIRQVFNRFFTQMTMQYSNIYIRGLGASPVELGAVNSAWGLGRALISLPLGYVRDKFSVRKIYLIGVALLTLVPLIYAVSNSWEIVVLAILISGLGMMMGSCVMYCDLCLPNEDRATGKALCEGIGAFPTILAPTVAAVLVTWFGGINVEGIRPLFWLQFVVRIILLGFVYLKVTEIGRSGVEARWTSPIRDFAEVIRRGTATKRWLLFLSLNMFTRTIVETFMYPYAHEIKGADQFIVGGITTTIILTETIFSTPLGRFADRFGRKKMFYMLIPLFSLGNLLLVLSPFPQWLILVGFLMGFRMISTFAYGSMTPELVPTDCIGRWRGLVGFFTGLVSLPAPIIGGFIWERMGPHWVFITPILIDVFIRMAILYTVPETLNPKKTDEMN